MLFNFLYNTPPRRTILCLPITTFVIRVKRAVPSMCKKFDIDPDLYTDTHTTLNEFFIREYKDINTIRPLGDSVLLHPADGKTLYSEGKNDEDIIIKGITYTYNGLLGMAGICKSLDDDDIGSQFVKVDHTEWNLMVTYLSPQNYHRFHVPCTGQVVDIKSVGSKLDTVNIDYISDKVTVYDTNVRTVIKIRMTNGTPVYIIAVGAMIVGSIRLYVKVSDMVTAGDQLGCFMFGGSTIITLYPKSFGYFPDERDVVEVRSNM